MITSRYHSPTQVDRNQGFREWVKNGATFTYIHKHIYINTYTYMHARHVGIAAGSRRFSTRRLWV